MPGYPISDEAILDHVQKLHEPETVQDFARRIGRSTTLVHRRLPELARLGRCAYYRNGKGYMVNRLPTNLRKAAAYAHVRTTTAPARHDRQETLFQEAKPDAFAETLRNVSAFLDGASSREERKMRARALVAIVEEAADGSEG